MHAQLIGTGDLDLLVESPAYSVYVKRNWTDAYTWIPWVECLGCGDGKGGSSTFQWDFGNILQPGALSFALYDFLDIGGCYVQVWAHDSYGSGCLVTQWISKEEVRPGANSEYPMGDQTFESVGLDQLLYFDWIKGSWAVANGIAQYTQRPIAFNEDGLPNMSPTPAALGDHYVFYRASQGDTASEFWTNAAIVDYAVGLFANGDGDGGWDGPPFLVTGFTAPLFEMAGTFNPYLQNVGDVVKAMISPSRGLDWRILTTGAGYVYIDVYSYFADENPDWYVIDASDRRIQARVKIDHAERFDFIHVQGGPVTICGTWALSDPRGYAGPLLEGWDATAEAAYLAAHDDTKRATDEYMAVFQRFEVDKTWDWMLGSFNASPLATWDGGLDFGGQSAQAYGFARFLRQIPFYQTQKDGGTPTLRAPFVVVYVDNGDLTDFVGWQLVHKLTPVQMKSAHVTPLEDCLGVLVEPPMNHVAAYGTLDPEASGETTETDPEYDFGTYYLTAAIETDVRLNVILPVSYTRLVNEVPRTKIIEDKDSRATIIAPYTIVDVDASDPTSLVDSGSEPIYVRDDGWRIWAKAQLAANFFGQQRAVASALIEGIHLGYAPGGILCGLVDAAGFTEIGTVVSRRYWDIANNQMTVETGRVDVDKFELGPRGPMMGAGGGDDWTSGTIITPTVVTPTPVTPTTVTPTMVQQTPVRPTPVW